MSWFEKVSAIDFAPLSERIKAVRDSYREQNAKLDHLAIKFKDVEMDLNKVEADKKLKANADVERAKIRMESVKIDGLKAEADDIEALYQQAEADVDAREGSFAETHTKDAEGKLADLSAHIKAAEDNLSEAESLLKAVVGADQKTPDNPDEPAEPKEATTSEGQLTVKLDAMHRFGAWKKAGFPPLKDGKGKKLFFCSEKVRANGEKKYVPLNMDFVDVEELETAAVCIQENNKFVPANGHVGSVAKELMLMSKMPEVQF